MIKKVIVVILGLLLIGEGIYLAVLMGKLEEALEDLDKEDYNEIALAAMQDLNILLGGLIKIWDQWASGMSAEMDRLINIQE